MGSEWSIGTAVAVADMSNLVMCRVSATRSESNELLELTRCNS